jgi:elongator complex protein 3
MTDYFEELCEYVLRERPTKTTLSKEKIRLSRRHGLRYVPSDVEVLLHSKDHPRLRRLLQSKPVRSQSGVSVVALMTEPSKCPHGRCITCPGGPGSVYGDVPQSYTGEEPASRRAKRNNYDAYLQVFNRLEQYVASGHIPQKVELIVMGGTFPALPTRYRNGFLGYAFKALNDFGRHFFRNGDLDIGAFKRFFMLPGRIDDPLREKVIRIRALKLKGKASLSHEQERNETSFVRCVGLTIETRPDYGKLKHGLGMLRQGCTRVELGVQSVYDESLVKMERGHATEDSIESIQILKDLGFKINIHYMPGLFVSRKKDLEGMRTIFSDARYRPDMLKIYPCMVMQGTKLHDMWKAGRYKPLSTEDAVRLIGEFKRSVPEYCRIMRVQRDIPTKMIAAGVDRTNLRQYVSDYMSEHGIVCDCIRCKEIGERKLGRITMKVMRYDASGGIEYFVSAESNGMIAGFCRLRLPGKAHLPALERAAIVRELHVYGEAAELGGAGKVQHRGIGKKLLATAERIASAQGKSRVAVLSGIGARAYYRKFGYRIQGGYMVKSINIKSNQIRRGRI